MVINTNIEAQATANNLKASQLALAKSLARLSSGSKIIVPSDDAAGLAVSSRLNSQIKRLDSALNNVVNAVSFTQTQDGFMKTIDKAFRRMGELAMLAQDSTKSDEDRALYNQEFAQLKDYVSETTKQDFNGVSLFGGKTLDVTVDADGTTFTMVGINLDDPTYTTATNSGTDAWQLSKNAWQISKDGYKAPSAVSKTSIDLWRDVSGNWAATDNGGIRIIKGSYVNDAGAAAVDTGETAIAKDNFISSATVDAGYKTDYIGNKLTKTAHGMSSGDAITFHSNMPGGLTAGTTYYVNSSDANSLTIHATKEDATGASNIINLTRTGISTSTTGISAAVNDNFTKANHGYKTGDKVVFNSGAPAGATNGTSYYVREGADANTFTLHTTAANAASNAGKVDITAIGSSLTLESTMKASGNVDATTDIVTMSSHGLVNGAKVLITTTSGGATADTAAYVKKLDANTYELYTNSDLATGKVNFSAAVTDQSFRLSVDVSSTNVAIYDKGNELKSGMFLTYDPGTVEDRNAVAVKIGDVVTIAKTTQDISSFATEMDENYDNVNLKSVEASQIALTLVKLAITQVATDRAKLGAVQSRLNFTNEQLTVTKENLSAAISRISDVDVAEEATNYARYQILVASGTEMLKQANQLPQSALQLLR